MTWKRLVTPNGVEHLERMSAREGARLNDRSRSDRNESSPVILVSNRGPVNFERDPQTGALTGQPGAGGVVSGLLAATEGRAVTWIALAMNDGDREFARAHASGTAPTLETYPNIALRLVETSEDAYRRYYDSVSNKILWFTQHYLLQPGVAPVTTETPHDWDEGYVAVNEAVARTTLDELDRVSERALIVFQDYHLYLAPGIVREHAPWARLAHFIHIPWPDPRYWELLPETMTRAIFAGLAANDVVGFQTERDAHNFVDGAGRFLLDVSPLTPLPGETGALLVDGRRVSVSAYPIAATPSEVFAHARQEPDAATAALLARARPTPDHKIILRVDRVEPAKNIVAGFDAYERMLAERPTLRGRVTFVALLVPSREGLPEYQAVTRETRAAIERVNRRFGAPGWKPIIAVFGNDRARALAMMREYDALLVNPLIDGMNLVVKEGALANERQGVIVLSRTAGAYEQLGAYVLGVPPADTEAIANALATALTMPRARRRALATALVATLMGESAAQWLDTQLRDLVARTSGAARVTRVANTALAAGASNPRWRRDPETALDRGSVPRLAAKGGELVSSS
jgi:trehalose 6-phosphate synthase